MSSEQIESELQALYTQLTTVRQQLQQMCAEHQQLSLGTTVTFVSCGKICEGIVTTLAHEPNGIFLIKLDNNQMLALPRDSFAVKQ